MARYHSDSDDDRRSRHRHSKSSRKRDRRSRSRSRDRDRRRRSRSREDERRRRRSRSRSSERSYKSSTRSSSSRKGSRSGSRNTSDSETRKDGRDKREKSSSSGASQVSKEKTKEKMKSALKAVESKDEELKLEKEKRERAKLVPDAETILEIESNSFSAQSFSSSAGSKNKVVEKPEVAISNQSHENAMFGGSSSAVFNSLPLNAQTNNKSLTTTTEIVDKKNLLASCLYEDEDSKNARWVEKLKKLRQRFLSPT